MSENRKLAAILASDVVGSSRLAGADEDRTLARLRVIMFGAWRVSVAARSIAPGVGHLSIVVLPFDNLSGDAVEGKLTKLLSQSPNDARAHYWAGRIKVETNRGIEGIAEAERALVFNPNLASAHALIGLAKLVNGHPEETEAHEPEALRVSPHDTDANIWMAYIALGNLFLGDDEAALAAYRRAFEINQNYPIGHFLQAAAFAELDRIDKARAAVRVGLALNPGFTIRRYRTGAQSNNPDFLKRREQTIISMRKAGVPEE